VGEEGGGRSPLLPLPHGLTPEVEAGKSRGRPVQGGEGVGSEEGVSPSHGLRSGTRKTFNFYAGNGAF